MTSGRTRRAAAGAVLARRRGPCAPSLFFFGNCSTTITRELTRTHARLAVGEPLVSVAVAPSAALRCARAPCFGCCWRYVWGCGWPRRGQKTVSAGRGQKPRARASPARRAASACEAWGGVPPLDGLAAAASARGWRRRRGARVASWRATLAPRGWCAETPLVRVEARCHGACSRCSERDVREDDLECLACLACTSAGVLPTGRVCREAAKVAAKQPPSLRLPDPGEPIFSATLALVDQWGLLAAVAGGLCPKLVLPADAAGAAGLVDAALYGYGVLQLSYHYCKVACGMVLAGAMDLLDPHAPRPLGAVGAFDRVRAAAWRVPPSRPCWGPPRRRAETPLPLFRWCTRRSAPTARRSPRSGVAAWPQRCGTCRPPVARLSKSG